VRESRSETARRNLLFRDFLRANAAARDASGDFKQQLALIAQDVYQYGQVKAGPTEILMIAAEDWASANGWTVSSACASYLAGATCNADSACSASLRCICSIGK
jgi:hypothetical protein